MPAVTFDSAVVARTNPFTGISENVLEITNVRLDGAFVPDGFTFEDTTTAISARNRVERALAKRYANIVETDPDHVDTIVQLIAEKAETFRIAFRDFVHSRYSPERQQTFTMLRAEARLDGLTNRANYIGQGLVWIDSAFMYFYTKVAEMQAAATRAVIDAVTWDFAGLVASDPLITIEAARGIPD